MSRRVIKCYRTKFCACGCGRQFKEDSRYLRSFIHGHRTPEIREKIRQANLGTHPSLETREKNRQAHLGEKNYNFGKHHTPAAKEKMREVHRRSHLSEETRAKMRQAHLGTRPWNYGLTKETDLRVLRNAENTRKTTFQKFQDPVYKAYWMKAHWSRNAEIREGVLQKCMVGAKLACCHPNKFELRIHKFLETQFPGEFIYTGNRRIGKSGYNPDFVHIEEKLVILCNGIYWHITRDGLYDSLETREQLQNKESTPFISCGVSILIIWEDEKCWGRLAEKASQRIQCILSTIRKFS